MHSSSLPIYDTVTITYEPSYFTVRVNPTKIQVHDTVQYPTRLVARVYRT